MHFCFSRSSLETSKKWGMLALVNQLFKIYFKVGLLEQVFNRIAPMVAIIAKYQMNVQTLKC